jgi:hypothetical protein
MLCYAMLKKAYTLREGVFFWLLNPQTLEESE